jgi:hypothetical protein
VKKSSLKSAVREWDTNAVSGSAIAAAIRCFSSDVSLSASNTTPAGLPPSPLMENALMIFASTFISIEL